MQQLLGLIRRADKDFQMIEPGDRVAVGVSGGKDSLALLCALAQYRTISPAPFELCAMTLHLGLEPFDLSGISALCQSLEVPYTVYPTLIGRIVFEERKEENPCALCARMRRGALNNLCVEMGFNKLALGHHRDDALETFMMSMLYEGRLRTFQPVTHLSRTGITVLRPMIYASEKQILHVVKTLNLPVVPSPCPANGKTARADMKTLMDQLCKKVPNARAQMLTALKNTGQYALWDKLD